MAAEARSLGYGGVAKVARASGVGVATILRGLKEIKKPGHRIDASRIRRSGGGRKSLAHAEPRLTADLDSLVEPATRGDPESPLRWTCKSLRALAKQLQAMGHAICYATVGALLRRLWLLWRLKRRQMCFTWGYSSFNHGSRSKYSIIFSSLQSLKYLNPDGNSPNSFSLSSQSSFLT
ncbi:MAG: hypothetical protein HY796_04110 [Elusimicrobia bacterium]|nr:hypothetical protein [Elusimicrobiota bacterium]